MNEHRIREIYQISLDTNRATFAEGEYDIAYHLLLVALQCAQRLRDADYLTEITRLAEKESRFIDGELLTICPGSFPLGSRRGK